MANKRDTSKQRRARQNRARREALEARTKAATEKTTADSPIEEPSRWGRRKSTPSSSPSRPDPKPRPGRLGDEVVDPEELEGSWLRRVVTVPGGLQVVMAATLVVALSVMASVVHIVPPDGAPADAAGTRTIWDAYGASAIFLIAPPILIVGNSLLFALHPKRRRMWLISAILLGLFSLLATYFVFPAGFLGYAVLRARLVEDGKGTGRRRRVADPSTDDEPSAGAVADEAPDDSDRD